MTDENVETATTYKEDDDVFQEDSRPMHNSKPTSPEPAPRHHQQNSFENNAESPKPTTTHNKPLPRPVSSRSLNFDSSNTNNKALKRSTSNFSIAHPHLMHSINDFKHIGEQFKVGKPNPNNKAPHEIRFKKMWESRTKKLASSSQSAPMTPSPLKPNPSVVGDYKRTKDTRLLANSFHLNDFKFTGDQFKVGRPDPKVQNPVEKRFQAMFKKRLEVLSPRWDEVKKTKSLSFHEMKELHNQLALKSK